MRFGNDAPESSMEINLGGYLIRKKVALGVDDGDGGLVAGALDRKDRLTAGDRDRVRSRSSAER